MKYEKFPRTPHLPWSPGFSGDDTRLADTNNFIGKRVIVTEKLDGENTTIYSDGTTHARAIDGKSNIWQDYIKNLAASKIKKLIPANYRICGENMYAVHSIKYEFLDSYFYIFAIIDSENIVLPYHTTFDMVNSLGLQLVPLLDTFIWENDKDAKKRLSDKVDLTKSVYGYTIEGYVVRNAEEFSINDYDNNVAKFVRKDHVKTDEHWSKNWEKARLCNIQN